MPINVALSQFVFADYIRAGDLVVWGQGQAEPVPLTQRLMQQRHEIGEFSVFLGINYYDTCQSDYADCIRFMSYCGAGNRALAKHHKLGILPSHYSQFPALIAARKLPIDVVIIQVAGPNQYGQYSYSLAQDYMRAAIKHARFVIAEINQQAPWVYSEYYLTEDDFDVIIHTDRTIGNPKAVDNTTVNQQIAANVAQYIDDGMTLQIGIGALPEAVLQALSQHQNLGVHSGIISDGVVALMQAGVINNRYKEIDAGKTITGLISGSSSLHQFVTHNRQVELRDISYTHHSQTLAKFQKLAAINSAIEVDITGQVNAEMVNNVYVGAVGGAIDFSRAASLSSGGCSIIAMPSAGKDFTRIVSQLQGPVTVPRSDVGIVVTEFGAADLRGLTLSERVNAMISIAAPPYRDQLMQSAKQSQLI